MKLKGLEMQGFKSFPDKTRIDFDAGMTAVIGPNGSGKSNISDAVRWALGEMSVKGLRGSRMEDVIFSGSKKRAAANCASVSLYLEPDERDKTGEVGEAGSAGEVEKAGGGDEERGGEIVVTRKYYRSGDSEYYLNKKQVRLKDVYERFYDTGIGREGYSVIGQGKIANVLSQKSEERRSIFEEAAGISKFRFQKTESERKLDATQDNLQRVADIMGEIGARLGPLEKEAENAKKYLGISEEKRGLEISLWLNKIEALKEEISKGGERLAEAQAELDAAEKRIGGIESGADALYLSGSEISRDISLAEKEINETELKIAGAEGEKALKRNDIAHFQKLADDAAAEIESSDAERASLDAAAEAAESAKRAAAAALEAAKTELGGKTERHTALRAGYEEKSAARNALQSDYTQSLERRQAAAAGYADLKAKLENAVRAAESSAGEMSEFKRRIAETREKSEKLKAELADAEKTLSEAKAAQGRALSEQKAAEGRLEKLKANKAEIAFAAASLKQQRENLLRMEELLEGYSEGVKNVLSAAKAGKIHRRDGEAAVYGTVSGALSTDEKYALALETALGGAVQHLIVEGAEDAKTCIKYLKETRGGRASFLPVATIRGARADVRAVSGCEGFIGLGCDLCGYDAKYRGIFERLLGDTVVCTDIDRAAGIAEKCRYGLRLVTLDGQVIHRGGSFTGGSAAKRAGILTRGADIERLARSVEAKLEELAKAEEAFAKQASVAKALAFASESAAMRLAVLKSKRDSASNSADLEDMRLEEEKRRYEVFAAECCGAEQRATELSAAAEHAAEKLKAADGEAEELSAKLAEAEKAAVLAEKASAAAYDEAAKARLLAAERENALARCGERAAMAEERRKALDRRVEECKVSVGNAESLIGERQLQIQELERRQAEYAGEKTAIRGKIERLLEGRAENEKKSVALREELREAQSEKEEAFCRHTELQSRLSMVSAEYDDYAAKLWEGYELTYSAALPFRLPPEKMKKASSRLNALKAQLRAMGNINVNAVDEYRETKARYDFYKAQTDDLEKTGKKLNYAIEKLEANMKNRFVGTFERINTAFGEVFAELFGGGTAKCLLADENDPLGSGIDIVIRPPGKSIRNINLLSTGEQSFAALALYLALQKINPAPFCIFDEIESALDEVNVNILADYLKRHSSTTQFILITHSRGTMERADVIYGITMREKGVSEHIRLDFRDLEKSGQLKAQ